MFGLNKMVKDQFSDYLQVIRPWAMGIENRGWRQEDFFTRNPDTTSPEMWLPKEDILEYRTDPSHVIFPLVPYEITILDRLFMGRRLLSTVRHLNQTINNFNSVLDEFAAAQAVETRWALVVMLHTGLIGSIGTGGLYDRFRNATAALGPADVS